MIHTELGRALDESDMKKTAEDKIGKATAADFLDLFKDVGRGGATSVWAATDPALKGNGPLYLEDAHVAARIEAPNRTHGVLDYARCPEAADRLWHAVEDMVGRKLPL